MEKLVSEITLQNEELESLPLFFKHIYFNKLVNVEDEEKLYKYSTKMQSIHMRDNEPGRIICKTFDRQILNEND